MVIGRLCLRHIIHYPSQSTDYQHHLHNYKLQQVAPFGSLRPIPGCDLGLCAICGEWIGQKPGGRDRVTSEDSIFKVSAKWRACLENQGYLSGQTSDLHNAEFRKPWMWAWLYRVIIYETSTKTFCLTGVSMVVDGHDCLIQAPEDSDQFDFCIPLEESMGRKLTEAYPLEIPHRVRRKTGASGYDMHEGCWVLTTRLLDVNVIKAHLKEFINALPWALRTAGRRANFIPPADPLSLLELREFLAQEQETYRVARHKQRSNTGADQLYVTFGMPLGRVFMQSFFTQVIDLRSGITSRAARSLPSELILQIMDYLPGSQEILHLMLVFPFWAPKVPYFYWGTRFRKELTLEQDELPDLDALNWQRAYCGLDYLYGASQAIRGRRRILAEIQPIKERSLVSLRNK